MKNIHLASTEATKKVISLTSCANSDTLREKISGLVVHHSNPADDKEMFSNDNTLIIQIRKKILDEQLTRKEIAYLLRIIRIYSLPNLDEQNGNPVNMVTRKLLDAQFFRDFEDVRIPHVVSELATFDVFNFPETHVARRPSDSYFINKSSIKKDSLLLRPHMSAMWYYYLIEGKGKKELEETGEIKVVTHGKIYRVDTIDTTHHECFHQMDGLRIVSKEKEIIGIGTLKTVLSNIVGSLFGANINYRYNESNISYATHSLELEVEWGGRWRKVLGAVIIHPNILDDLGIDSNKYNGWAFGLGLERIAMVLKGIPDIRMFWSDDERITDQWGTFEPFKRISTFPPVYKDMTFIVPKDKFIKDVKRTGEIKLVNDVDSFEITSIARDISGLIEEIKVVDIFENSKKFGEEKKSVCVRLIFRSLDHTLTNEEINVVYFKIRERIEKELGFELR